MTLLQSNMALQMISNDDSIYLSAPTSPYLENLDFYSAPTSPFRHAYKPTFDHAGTEPTTPKSCTYDDDYEDANNNFIEFEFETSRRYTPDDYDFDQMVQRFESPCQQQEQLQQHHQHKELSLPAMAFADELFCDGKVMPLKPPPCRLQKGSCNNVSSCLSSSPKSPTAALKLPFSRRISLWNDDFDPFMVALENVKVDDMEMRNKEERDHRRARSMSPLRARSPQGPSKSMSFHHTEIKTQMGPDGPHSKWVPYKNRKIEKEEPKGGPLDESKGLLFAKQTRLVKMTHEKPKTGESGGGKGSAEPSSRESKRQKMKKLLFKSASIGRANNEEKQKDKPFKKSFTTKFNFRSTAKGNGDKRVSQVTKVTLMQHRPRLFICLGYGPKSVK